MSFPRTRESIAALVREWNHAMTRRKRLFLFVLIPSGLLLLVIVCWPFISAFVFFGFVLPADLSRIERKICLPANFQPAGKDLAILSTFTASMIDGRHLPYEWTPGSLVNVNIVRWYAGPEGAGALFTCGFSHLSYRLEKSQTEGGPGETIWDMFVDDEGRRKYLDRIVVTQADRTVFDSLIAATIEEFDRQLAEDPSSVELAERKTNFLLAAGIADGSVPSEERQYLEAK